MERCPDTPQKSSVYTAPEFSGSVSTWTGQCIILVITSPDTPASPVYILLQIPQHSLYRTLSAGRSHIIWCTVFLICFMQEFFARRLGVPTLGSVLHYDIHQVRVWMSGRVWTCLNTRVCEPCICEFMYSSVRAGCVRTVSGCAVHCWLGMHRDRGLCVHNVQWVWNVLYGAVLVECMERTMVRSCNVTYGHTVWCAAICTFRVSWGPSRIADRGQIYIY